MTHTLNSKLAPARQRGGKLGGGRWRGASTSLSCEARGRARTELWAHTSPDDEMRKLRKKDCSEETLRACCQGNLPLSQAFPPHRPILGQRRGSSHFCPGSPRQVRALACLSLQCGSQAHYGGLSSPLSCLSAALANSELSQPPITISSVTHAPASPPFLSLEAATPWGSYCLL